MQFELKETITDVSAMFQLLQIQPVNICIQSAMQVDSEYLKTITQQWNYDCRHKTVWTEFLKNTSTTTECKFMLSCRFYRLNDGYKKGTIFVTSYHKDMLKMENEVVLPQIPMLNQGVMLIDLTNVRKNAKMFHSINYITNHTTDCNQHCTINRVNLQ